MNYSKWPFSKVVEWIVGDIQYYEKQQWEPQEIFEEIDAEYNYELNKKAIISAFKKCGYTIG